MYFKNVNAPQITERTFENIIIFGAGAGFSQQLSQLTKRGHISHVVDNNPSKWGQKIHGYEIFPPETLKYKNQDDSIIICSWWKKQISQQLISYGLSGNIDFFLDVDIFLSPKHFFQIFIEFITFLHKHSQSLAGKEVLHIGVGQTLIVDILLAMAGAKVTCSNLDNELIFFPDISLKKNIYSHLNSFYMNNRKWFILPPEALISTTSSKIRLDSQKVHFQPMDIESLPLKSQSMDYIFSYDLLEHVEKPSIAIEESMRILKPQGMFYHHIHPGEHRSKQPPFAMYTSTQQEWQQICQKQGYHHNRWLSCQFINHFGQCSNQLIEATSRIAPDPQSDYFVNPDTVAPEFRKFSPKDFHHSTGFLTIGGIV